MAAASMTPTTFPMGAFSLTGGNLAGTKRTRRESQTKNKVSAYRLTNGVDTIYINLAQSLCSLKGIFWLYKGQLKEKLKWCGYFVTLDITVLLLLCK